MFFFFDDLEAGRDCDGDGMGSFAFALPLPAKMSSISDLGMMMVAVEENFMRDSKRRSQGRECDRRIAGATAGANSTRRKWQQFQPPDMIWILKRMDLSVAEASMDVWYNEEPSVSGISEASSGRDLPYPAAAVQQSL